MTRIKYIIADGNSFEAITQRVHHLAKRLAQEDYILYIEEPGNIISIFLSQEKPVSNLWKWFSGLRLEQHGTYVFTPPPMLPFGYISPTINAFNHWVQGLILKIYTREMDFSHAVLLIPNILGKGWRHLFRKSPMIYDCCDEITEFKIPSLRKEVARREEIELMHDCDLVVVSSQLLYEKKRIHTGNIDIIRNGCEYEFFATCEELRMQPPPSDLELIKKAGPVIGFFGNIAPWFDTDIVAGILNNRTNWQVVLIGPSFINLDRFQVFPNFHYLGKKPYKELPSYLAHFDCGIIPFIRNELTKYVNPVKAYEYLAGGVGVVATPLDEYNYFDGLVIQAETIDQFISAIEQVLELKQKDIRDKRMNFAKLNDWKIRLDNYVELIKSAGSEHYLKAAQKAEVSLDRPNP
jgi:hypothetical protein